ncbi:ImmA/IrrE family metallo-endopeptidase [Virgibacillus sp. AGTR]|uniref:ImmA/IrrE family metallo-endopeptidase n=1 Tax=Virgibacillus sp. AGTR TaxID=2812055 RepID=UPI001D166A5E|nr:ImmA/IrrE family metallo-endopeptidase [Virgibacillus sp. AGTR]MCC2248818.1 ImmA/IrrE family metallo-endopeptidase [Virgibacillus sp. AGTR]
MYSYDSLLEECDDKYIEVYERKMKSKGLYSNNIIWINKLLPTYADKLCVLAEEIGHYYTSAGDILDQTKLVNRKQEQLARSWAYEKIVPLSKIVQAHKGNIRNKYELAEFLGVTETFLEHALKRYKEKYGVIVNYGKYTIAFEPLGVQEWLYKNF